MNWLITYEVYDRGGEMICKVAHYQAPNEKKMLEYIHENHLYPLEEEENTSVANLKKLMEESNGQGCDTIFSIINAKTRNVLFTEGGGWENPDFHNGLIV